MATQIGSKLQGVLYVLDEPSIGLHQRDNEKLIQTLRNLQELGNTVLVVEHDEDTIRRADYVLEIGPKAGKYGGEVIAQGTPGEIMKSSSSSTGKYLSYMLWVFGTAWGGYSLIAFLAFGEPLTWSILFVMGVSFLVGWILKRVLRRKTYKIGKKRKLRIIDMTIEPFRPKP